MMAGQATPFSAFCGAVPGLPRAPTVVPADIRARAPEAARIRGAR